MRFDRKVSVVTGAASGIGAACATALAGEGACVALLDTLAREGAALAGHLDGSDTRVRFWEADVSQAEPVERAVRAAHSQWGRLDVLVVSAGIQRYGTALDTSDEEWARVLAVNLTGAWHAARACLRFMTAGSAIVLVSSVQGLASQQNVCGYTTSKHGLIGLTRSLAVDFAPKGIRANVVCPGTVDTPMLRWAALLDPYPESVYDACAAMHPLGRIATPDEIARVVVFLASDDASFMTGSIVTVDGGLLTMIAGAPRTEASK
jgi:NAD(P)-dependent dehydrogenase (short-subunit alcohol dehydrogenase family)